MMSFWDSFANDRLLVDTSLWSADLSCLRDAIRKVDDLVDLYHFDVSDAHFVPGLLFFPDLVAALRPLTRKRFHVHLMVDHPVSLVEDFAQAGADLITVHVDTGQQAADAVKQIVNAGINAGLAFSLDVPIEKLLPYLDMIDLVLLMGTPMGIKGQGLSPLAASRIREMHRLLIEHGLEGKIKIEADGGIRTHTVPALRSAGADLVVAGSLVFKSEDLAQTFAWLRDLPPQS
jgi:ribulose-phosphate 3-epimerase